MCYAQIIHADGSGGYVQNRVNCSHLMKMYLLFRDTVRFRLCPRENPENLFRQRGSSLRQASSPENFQNFR